MTLIMTPFIIISLQNSGQGQGKATSNRSLGSYTPTSLNNVTSNWQCDLTRNISARVMLSGLVLMLQEYRYFRFRHCCCKNSEKPCIDNIILQPMTFIECNHVTVLHIYSRSAYLFMHSRYSFNAKSSYCTLIIIQLGFSASCFNVGALGVM